jgi:hypothetical protein
MLFTAPGREGAPTETWRGLWSLIEQRFKVAPAVYHPENENVFTFDAIDNNVLAHGEAARAGAEILVTGTSDVREGGEKEETVGDRVNQATSMRRFP